jgi:predicted butyrate kinase (DUF1464 family)
MDGVRLRALGVDPGTKNFDICCIEDDAAHVILDESISTDIVAEDSTYVLKIIKNVEPDVILGPSGYGLEFKHITQFTVEDVALTTLDKKGDAEIPVLLGLRKLLWMMKEDGLNAYSVPGIILLPTIPPHRKVNKIDMGTADKTCVAAMAIWDQAEEYGVSYKETSLICVEMGFGYNAAIAVENGQIIDGVGGTIFPGPGYLSPGQMDGELAYILGKISKLDLFQSGVTFIAADKVVEVDDFFANVGEERHQVALASMVEGIVKAVAMLLTVFNKQPREIILTGRLSRVNVLQRCLEKVLGEKFGIATRRTKHNFAKKSKEAAQGAALLANGIFGGKYADLAETLRVKEAKGTVLDYIYFKRFNKKQVLERLRYT